jgi:ADP-heptose:LPS heptosyltransferase
LVSPLLRQGEGPLSARRPLIGIHAGAHAPARRWPAERFAVVADHLAQRFGAQIMLTGGPGEEEIAQAVAERMAAPALNLAGRTSLGALGALIAALDLYVTNDSGPAHLAYAALTPSVTIFGPGDLERWGPLDGRHHRVVREPVACSPCGYQECPIDHRCLRWIAPARVIDTAEALLRQECVTCND